MTPISFRLLVACLVPHLAIPTTTQEVIPQSSSHEGREMTSLNRGSLETTQDAGCGSSPRSLALGKGGSSRISMCSVSRPDTS